MKGRKERKRKERKERKGMNERIRTQEPYIFVINISIFPTRQ